MTSPDEPQEEGERKPFMEHLEDLRRTLIWSAAALVVGMIVAIPLAPKILALLKAPLRKAVDNPDQFVRTLDISGGFSVATQVVFWSGFLFSSPFIFLFVWRFIFPALRIRERRAIVGGAVAAVLLFVAGVAMGYYLTMPAAVRIMIAVSTWMGVAMDYVTVNSYVAFTTQVLIAFGLAFELPMVVLVLGRLGVISSAQLRDKRRHIIVLLFIIAMILTPPDVVSQLLMAVPLVVLYEISIWMVWAGEKRRGDAPSGPAPWWQIGRGDRPRSPDQDQ